MLYVPRTLGGSFILVWVDLDGNETVLALETGSYRLPGISPDADKNVIYSNTSV